VAPRSLDWSRVLRDAAWLAGSWARRAARGSPSGAADARCFVCRAPVRMPPRSARLAAPAEVALVHRLLAVDAPAWTAFCTTAARFLVHAAAATASLVVVDSAPVDSAPARPAPAALDDDDALAVRTALWAPVDSWFGAVLGALAFPRAPASVGDGADESPRSLGAIGLADTARTDDQLAAGDRDRSAADAKDEADDAAWDDGSDDEAADGLPDPFVVLQAAGLCV
jgi:hypothetical protein